MNIPGLILGRKLLMRPMLYPETTLIGCWRPEFHLGLKVFTFNNLYSLSKCDAQLVGGWRG